jgi:hypothetical protein
MTYERWRKSSYSDDTGGNCVELAETDDGILVRNSNHLDEGTLTLTRAELAAWLKSCKAGEYDHLI